MRESIVLAAGGTGGHMFPALAVAEALRQRGRQVTLLTDRRGAQYVPADTDFRVIDAASPAGGLRSKVRFSALLAKGVTASLLSLRQLRPAAAAAFGGYACVPAALATSILRIPLLVHEQNAVLGKANRLVVRFARCLALSFSPTQHAAGVGMPTIVTGNPVRLGFNVSGSERRLDDPFFRVLVLGGSQGARIFSDMLPAAIALLPDQLRARLRVAQQCRPEDLDRTRAAYAQVGFDAELAAFFHDVPARMASCQLVIARSGASTIAELLTCGRASLLVPYPHAADDHQAANAQAVADKGAAVVLAQSELSPERIGKELERLIAGEEEIAAMERAANRLARRDAARRLADAVLALTNRESAA